MKKSVSCCVFVSVLLLLVLFPVGAVRIRQVVVGPFDIVQLENPSDEFAVLDGLVLATEVSPKDVLLKGSIPPHGFFTVGETDAPVPVDLVDTLTLYNIDSGVALMNLSGGGLGVSTVLDAVSWGNSSGIPSSFLRGFPSANPGSESLLRVSDTNDSSIDFVLSPMELQGNVVRVAVVAGSGGVTSTLDSIQIADVSARSGVQIVLRPGNDSFVSVNVTGSGLSNGSLSVGGVTGVLGSCVVASNTSLCGGVTLPYSFPPGEYDVVVRAGGSEIHGSLTVLPLLSLDVIPRRVFVDDVVRSVDGGVSDSSLLPRVVNLGNVPLRVFVSKVGGRGVDVGSIPSGGSVVLGLDAVAGDVFVTGVPE